MKVQVLVATMNQTDHALAGKMNLQTEAIIANQCDRFGMEEYDHNGHKIKMYNFAERGVGLNRNNALMRSDADICLIADDDMVFYDGYEQTIIDAFNKYPKADFLVLNIDESGATDRRKNTKVSKVGLKNYLNYGAARFAFRREAITKHGIYFNLHFGGGTEHSCGEDSLFLRQCLLKKLKILSVPVTVAKLVEERESSWFKGYTEKYFYDEGYFLGTAHPRIGGLFARYLVLRHKDYLTNSSFTRKQILKMLKKGIKDSKKRD